MHMHMYVCLVISLTLRPLSIHVTCDIPGIRVYPVSGSYVTHSLVCTRALTVTGLTRNMNKMYGFEGEVLHKYDAVVMRLFSEVFANLPLAAVIQVCT